MEFMRKYIHVAKLFKPALTSEAANYIAEEYTRLRNQDQMSTDVARVSPAPNVPHLQAILLAEALRSVVNSHP